MSNHFHLILQKTNNLSDIYSADNWFTQIAEYLLRCVNILAHPNALIKSVTSQYHIFYLSANI
jgi:hypothetical protein